MNPITPEELLNLLKGLPSEAMDKPLMLQIIDDEKNNIGFVTSLYCLNQKQYAGNNQIINQDEYDKLPEKSNDFSDGQDDFKLLYPAGTFFLVSNHGTPNEDVKKEVSYLKIIAD